MTAASPPPNDTSFKFFIMVSNIFLLPTKCSLDATGCSCPQKRAVLPRLPRSRDATLGLVPLMMSKSPLWAF